MPQSLRHANWKFALVAVLLFGACIEFIWRGPARFLRLGYQWSDISQVYVPSRAWVKGLNPYSPDNFVLLCQQATGASPSRSDIRTHSPYPLTTLVIVSPMSALPWPDAHVLWALILGLIPLPAILALAGFAGFTRRISIYLFAALVLALAPLHTGIAVGNVSIPAIALCAIAVWAAGKQRDVVAGLLLGVATCLKPQLGVWFVLYYVLRKKWSIALCAVGLGAIVLLGGILRLEANGVSWLQDFLQNARGFAVENQTVDFTDRDPIRFTLINLQVLIFSIARSTLVAHIVAWVTGALLFASWYLLAFRSNIRPPDLLTLSTLMVFCLLPAYHRNYDAAVLMFPLCWLVSRLEVGTSRGDKLALLLLLPFAVPGGALLQHLADDGRIPGFVVGGWWWNILIMPHEIWCLLLLVLLLLREMALAAPQPAQTFLPRT